MNKIAAMFPGQGSQYVGMTQKLYEDHEEVRELFKQAEEALGFDLYDICKAGPAQKLQKTEYTQPALLTAGVAAFTVYRKEGGQLPGYGAGHSLGEITALCCAGAVTFQDAVKLVHIRGKLMQEAVPEGIGAMAAVMGIDPERIEEICKTLSDGEEMVAVSNYNAPTQTVISGHAGAVGKISEMLVREGGNVVPLKVSAPFHSPLMEFCAAGFKEALDHCDFHDLQFPVISNVTGLPYPGREMIPEFLYRQITGAVLWQDIMKYLDGQGVDVLIEFGPGCVLKNLTAKNIPSMRAFSFDEDEVSIMKLIKVRGQENASDRNMKVLTSCIAAAVSTKNSNWDEEAYRTGVAGPYRELVRMRTEAKETGLPVSSEDVNKGMEFLKKILETKQVDREEQKSILEEIERG